MRVIRGTDALGEWNVWTGRAGGWTTTEYDSLLGVASE